MTYNDIEVGKNYVFDPNNLMNQTETGISVIHITDKKKRFLMPSIIYGKSLNERTNVIGESDMMVSPEYIGNEYDTEHDHIVIRFPDNIPSFSSMDIAIMDRLIKAAFDQKRFSDEEMVAILSLHRKVSFYGNIQL